MSVHVVILFWSTPLKKPSGSLPLGEVPKPSPARHLPKPKRGAQLSPRRDTTPREAAEPAAALLLGIHSGPQRAFRTIRKLSRRLLFKTTQRMPSNEARALEMKDPSPWSLRDRPCWSGTKTWLAEKQEFCESAGGSIQEFGHRPAPSGSLAEQLQPALRYEWGKLVGPFCLKLKSIFHQFGSLDFLLRELGRLGNCAGLGK